MEEGTDIMSTTKCYFIDYMVSAILPQPMQSLLSNRFASIGNHPLSRLVKFLTARERAAYCGPGDALYLNWNWPVDPISP